jgi:hypothetical protein
MIFDDLGLIFFGAGLLRVAGSRVLPPRFKTNFSPVNLAPLGKSAPAIWTGLSSKPMKNLYFSFGTQLAMSLSDSGP